MTRCNKAHLILKTFPWGRTPGPPDLPGPPQALPRLSQTELHCFLKEIINKQNSTVPDFCCSFSRPSGSCASPLSLLRPRPHPHSLLVSYFLVSLFPFLPLSLVALRTNGKKTVRDGALLSTPHTETLAARSTPESAARNCPTRECC